MLTSVTSVPVRSLTVIVVGAAEGVEVDRLDVVEVHRDVGDVAGEQHARRRSPRSSIFSAMLAPLNSSVSIPSWPSTMSLSSPGFQTKVSSPAPMRAVSLPSPPLIEVVALAADEEVGAEAAVHRQLDAVGLEAAGVDHVVAALAVERQPVVGLLLEEDVDRRAGGRDTLTPPASPATPIDVGALRAVDGHRVGRSVAAAVRRRAGRRRPE